MTSALGDGEATTQRVDPSQPAGSQPSKLPHIGRFLPLRLLGTGASGSVFSVYDPELDRKIALKLINIHRGEETARIRVQREVQAMARICHRNTVQIYDVGEYSSGVYIAMELIEGETLREWSEIEVRTWREVVEVLVQAGRGLQAAHDAGLVHRDFKPGNVLIDELGHVRVADFGLARGRGAADLEASPQVRGRSVLDSDVTLGGGLLGTPAYMAPELLEGSAADTRSDQYAFAVTLYEALYGSRPFPHKDFDELRRAVLRGALPPAPPVRPPVPAWLRRAVIRGLDVDPERRFPALRDFIAAIDRDPSKTWLRRIAIAGLIVVGLIVTSLLASGASPCEEMAAHLHGIWDEPRRQALRASLGRQLGPEENATIEEGLDGFARRWVTMRREACELSLARGGESVLGERRIACLEDRLAQLRPVVDTLSHRDDLSVIAAEVTSHIPSLDRCVDADSMMEVGMLPDDPESAAEVEDIRLYLAQAHAHRMVGDRVAANALLEQAVERAVAVDYGQVYAEALVEKARLQVVEPELLVPDLGRAMTMAEQAGDRRLRLVVALELLSHNSKIRHLYAAAAWDNVIDGLAPSFDGEPLLVADIARVKGVFAAYRGDDNEAVEQTKRAVAAFVRAGAANSPASIGARSNLGALLSRVHRYEEAVAVLRAAYADALRGFGPRHIRTLSLYMNLTTALARSGDGPGATEVLIEHRRFGPIDDEQSISSPLRIVLVLFEPKSLLAPDARLRLLPQLDRSLELIAEADLQAVDVDELALRCAYEVGRCRAEVLLEAPTALAVCQHSVGMAEPLLRSSPESRYVRGLLREALLGLARAEQLGGAGGGLATLRRAIAVELQGAYPGPSQLIELYSELRRWEDEIGHSEAAAVAARELSSLSSLLAAEGNSLASFPPSDQL